MAALLINLSYLLNEVNLLINNLLNPVQSIYKSAFIFDPSSRVKFLTPLSSYSTSFIVPFISVYLSSGILLRRLLTNSCALI